MNESEKIEEKESQILEENRRRQAAAIRGVGSIEEQELQLEQSLSRQLGQAPCTRLEQAIGLSNGLIQKINQETEVKNLKAKIKELENLLEFQNNVILDLFKQRTK